MHQRSFALTALLFVIIIVELSVVIITAEPTYRHHHRDLIDANNNKVAIDCTNDYTNVKCRSKFLNRNETGSIDVGKNNYGAEKKVEDEKKSLNVMDLLNDHKVEDDDDDDGDGAIEEGNILFSITTR